MILEINCFVNPKIQEDVRKQRDLDPDTEDRGGVTEIEGKRDKNKYSQINKKKSTVSLHRHQHISVTHLLRAVAFKWDFDLSI